MKQFVLALFLGAASAHAPHSVNLFATGDYLAAMNVMGDDYFTAPTNQEALQLADPSPIKKNKKDIANKEVRPDVWSVVNKMVEPTAYRRSAEAPPTQKEQWKEAGWGNPSPKEASDKTKKSSEKKEEREEKSATEAKPVKKTSDFEDDALEPKKEVPEDEKDIQIQKVLYDSQNQLWRF